MKPYKLDPEKRFTPKPLIPIVTGKTTIALADDMIRVLAGDDHDEHDSALEYIDNIIVRLREIKQVGVSRRIIELSLIRKRYE